MSRILTLALAGTTALGLSAGSMTAEAAPLPALTSAQVGGANATVDHVGWRRGGYYGGGYGYRGGYGRRAAGAAFAGAAIGLLGGAIAASAAPRYGYYGGGYGGYGGGYYGAGYGGYGGYAPSYGYAPAYSYGYAPAYGYGYPGYGW